MSKIVAIIFGVAGAVLAISAIWYNPSSSSHKTSQEGKPSSQWLEKWKTGSQNALPVFYPELEGASPSSPEKMNKESLSKKAKKRSSSVGRKQVARSNVTRPPVKSKTVSSPVSPKKTGSESNELSIGTLSVRSTPSGAAVFVDGSSIGRTPIEIDAFTGKHRVRVAHPSEEKNEQHLRVFVQKGEVAQVDIRF